MSDDPILDAIIAHDAAAGLPGFSPVTGIPASQVPAQHVCADLNAACAAGAITEAEREEYADFLLRRCTFTLPGRPGRFTVVDAVVAANRYFAAGHCTEAERDEDVRRILATARLDPAIDLSTFLGGYQRPPTPTTPEEP